MCVSVWIYISMYIYIKAMIEINPTIYIKKEIVIEVMNIMNDYLIVMIRDIIIEYKRRMSCLIQWGNEVVYT